jgi:hypothetical protein
LRTSAQDERVLDLVAEHVGRLRRADLARVVRPEPVGPVVDGDGLRQARRDRLNARKSGLTAQSSARWANAIIAGNDDQYRLARDAQYRHIAGLRAAIATITKRLAAPTVDSLTAVQSKVRRGRGVKGYATRAERFQKQRRLQHLRGELARAEADQAANQVRIVEGGKRLAKSRHHLDAAGLDLAQWRDRWVAARHPITANGSGDEPFGNLTVTVTPTGEVSVRLPKPLEHLANAKRGRYVLSGRAVFSHRGQEWAARITGGKSVSYTITREPGRAGRYLTASWATPAPPSIPRRRQHPPGWVRRRSGHRCRSQRRSPGSASSRRSRQPRRQAGTYRHRSIGFVVTAGCSGASRDHPPDPLRPPA